MKNKIFNEIAKSKTPISGDKLGEMFGMTRAGIAKHIKAIKASGANILTSKQGYSWQDNDDLNEYTLAYSLGELKTFFQVCDSTNNLAKSLALTTDDDFLVVAPHQISGKGRQDRKFASNVGGAYMSYCYHPKPASLTVTDSFKMVLITGLSVLNTLKKFGLSPTLKWPNDVFIQDKKICGILLESSLNCEFVSHIIFGIGINLTNEIPDEFKAIATSISEHTTAKISRIQIVCEVIYQLNLLLKEYEQCGFESLKKQYYANSRTIGNVVTIKNKDTTTTGKAIGISEEGFLILQCENEQVKIITGDIF